MAHFQHKPSLGPVVALLLLFACAVGFAGTKSNPNNNVPRLSKAEATFEQRLSSISNHEFYTTNYGQIGHNVAAGAAGWYWPRQSNRAYIFGQSIWFGVKRLVNGDTAKLVSVGYNPNSGVSWFAPGSVDDGLGTFDDPAYTSKYYMYMGSDFSPAGKNVKTPSLADWPIRWKNTAKTPGKNGYFGEYISDPAERASYPAVFISQEDMFAIYKDTDTKRNPEYKAGTGYPIGLDIQQTTYSWGFGPYRDFVFFVYNVINKSGDTLRSCFLAPASDPDIGNATNDHNSYYTRNPAYNLAYQLTETEVGYGGVLAMDFLESPIVKTKKDSIEVFRTTGLQRNIGQQIGLTTFRNWTIDVDPANGPARYDFMAAGVRDIDNGPGDKRLLLATGPFTMAPGDTARTVLCIMIAPGKGLWNALPDPQNSGYLDSLTALDVFAQSVYDNNFAAPKPPDPARVTASGIDRGVLVAWDTTSEASVDTLAGGADFYGYRVYRSRSQSGPWKLLMDTSMSTAPVGVLPSKYLAHTFLDVGADTSTGLYNNMGYYYWVSSYDQGDVVQNIKSLENTPVPNVNSVRVEPIGPSAGNNISYGNYSIPVSLGSIKNFRVEATQQLRFNQLFSGHPLKVTLQSVNNGTAYTVTMVVKDTIGNYSSTLSFAPGLAVVPTILNDTLITGVYRSAELFNCFKVAFDWSFVQRMDAFHLDTTIVTKGTANTRVARHKNLIDPNINFGEATFTIDFSVGGVDKVGIAFGDTVNLTYLKMTVRNTITGELVDTTTNASVLYNQWALNSVFWRSVGGVRTSVGVVNRTNKYYLSQVTGTDTVEVAHVFTIEGQQMGFDPFNLGGPSPLSRQWGFVQPATKDFSAGDQATTTFRGGVAGTGGAPALPLPGAYVTATASIATPAKYTAELLKQVKVVPNPYIISNEAQLTTDAPKLFFNHLPPKCTIRIYNVAGDQIKIINHNGGSQEVWDLLSDGREKVASQLLLAYIEADGANQLVKFAVIVGGFRSIR